MKLIVGLGNPGAAYINSRHNIGFRVVKSLAKDFKASFKKDSNTRSLSCKVKIGAKSVILAMPLTYMNLSGNAVAVLVNKYRIDSQDLLVICDNLDLEFGRQKIKASGSQGGHRGLKSIIDSLSCSKFARLRIGIGRPRQNIETSDYVLSAFDQNEGRQLRDIIERACDCCRSWVTQGITKTMNIFNIRSNKNE